MTSFSTLTFCVFAFLDELLEVQREVWGSSYAEYLFGIPSICTSNLSVGAGDFDHMQPTPASAEPTPTPILFSQERWSSLDADADHLFPLTSATMIASLQMFAFKVEESTSEIIVPH